jgi:hypothetical protein
MPKRIESRCDTPEAWQTYNPLLAAGEIGIALYPNGSWRQKIGNGVTRWNDLPQMQVNDPLNDHDVVNLKTLKQMLNNSGPVSFTPSLIGLDSPGDFTYTFRAGKYWIHDSMAIVIITMQLAAINTVPTGRLVISGLPQAVIIPDSVSRPLAYCYSWALATPLITHAELWGYSFAIVGKDDTGNAIFLVPGNLTENTGFHFNLIYSLR